MFVLKSSYEELQRELSAVEKNLVYNKEIVKSKDVEIENLENKIKELENKILSLYSKELEECEFEFDFKSTDAFSIERINKNGKNQTVIGYMKHDENTIGEWYLGCSFSQHQKLAEQFRNSVLKK